ncbi:PREDICTED: probable LRR receptor-like serine/threonine-protein kinase At3g47570 [Camelina sativa]|uniref:Probable LRR receptor-like serine/threonine-protein kinase At3g47570 n=1 Tax=Camelina sativa TaxID=90675 RepID=A0ABM0XEP1_CAMSA|nr:PREDICTED: probable LRR receptor-like serine/threonine-protein kinase At3g47570 [Camelina sativa]
MNVSYDELRRATDSFTSINLLGVGSFGSVFKGVIRGVDVAVKVIDLKAHGYYKGFIAECEALRSVRHRNLVKLITSCSNIDFKNTEFLALVYEFLSNGSLEEWIKGRKVNSDGSVGLSLEERVNVAIDIAYALDYLHNDCEVPVVHCDLKPSNILLNEEMVAKVGDFRLARVLFNASDDGRHASISSTHVLKGSIGYVPPEYGLGEKPSRAGDVYSFGVMLLELFSGKSPMDESFQGDQSLVKWISHGFQNNAIVEVIDPRFKGLMDDICGAQLPTKIDCLNKIVEVGLACTAYAAGERMNMRDVLRILINKAAEENKFGYHPRCHNLLLTHLCFADDLMVFAEGTKRSVEGVISIFDEFAKISGLKISLEKSTLYMAGISEQVQEEIRGNFPFAEGDMIIKEYP